MSELTDILGVIKRGEPQAAEQLLPLVYAELRRMAAHKMAQEKPGQTLSATGLVHEAYLRLFGGPPNDERGPQRWDNRGHFFSAAAEAMRRILVEQARRKGRAKHGGGRKRIELNTDCAVGESPRFDLLALDEALTRLTAVEPIKAELVKLRYFSGLTMPEAAQALGVSLATAERYWTFAKAWLYAELSDRPDSAIL